eukprot:CAMPEP_0185781596 /NCGR_PEP_ID=MMETSP1174-20130828/102977_1 /TAXON_ID=35687 /ORGANISM="Dictyocha speculum, Strain CCMP1381" /LENGTH=183 /DNA_ID=CAMNT_0028471645 /DNA_START=41 /DNA_END=592 /DNA_ORIENTATION=-
MRILGLIIIFSALGMSLSESPLFSLRGGAPRVHPMHKYKDLPIQFVPGNYAVQRRNRRRVALSMKRFEGIPKITVMSKDTKRIYVIRRGPPNEPLHSLEKRIAHRYKGIHEKVTFAYHYHIVGNNMGLKNMRDKSKTLMDYKVPLADNISIMLTETGHPRRGRGKPGRKEEEVSLEQLLTKKI